MISGSRVFRAADSYKNYDLDHQFKLKARWLNSETECILTLNRDDELRDDGEDLGLAVHEQIANTLDGKESVRILFLTDALHEDRQVVMVVQLAHLNLPGNLVGGTVLNLNG